MDIHMAWTNSDPEKPPNSQPQIDSITTDTRSTAEKLPPTLREFTQNTTFHGVKYVFEDTTWFRKLFWALVILGSMVFFVVQVGMRINDYYRYQTVTSVKRVTSDILPFPAVTLCNLNQFRISEAYDRGLYQYLDKQLQTNSKVYDPVLDDISNTTETIRSLGHQINQLIDSCLWQGSPCNMETDFVTHLLDIGLCFTFNHDVTNRKYVTQPGFGGGLKLMMNIEAYEHMRGSNLDSGVKFLLHEPGETPSLRNLGFVATSGQHTFVAIKHGEMHSLQAPWGDCVENGESVANCKHKCFSNDFIQHCNCTSTIAKHSQYLECDVATQLTCGCNNNSQDFTTCGINCTCPAPCKEIIYRPTLSSSGLSSTNIDMFVLKGENVFEKTKVSFHKAAETRLRLSSTYNESYVTPTNMIIQAYDTIRDRLSHYDISYNDSYMMLLLPAGISFHQSSPSFDPTLLMDKLHYLMDGKTCGPEMHEVADLIDSAINLLYLMQIELESLNPDPKLCINEYTQTLYGWYYYYSGGLYVDDSCSYCSSLNYMRQVPVCSPLRIQCVLCHIGHIHKIINNNPNLLSRIRKSAYKMRISYNNKAALQGVMWYKDQYDLTYDEECSVMHDYIIQDDVLFPLIFAKVENIDLNSPTAYTLFDFMNSTYSQVSELFQNVSKDVFVKKFSDVCCWQYRLLTHEYEMRFYNGTGYQDSFILSQKQIYEQAVYKYQAMSVSELVGDIQWLSKKYLDKLLTQFELKIDLLSKYTTSENFTTLHLIRNFYETSGARLTSTVITETMTEIEMMMKIKRNLDKIKENMGEYIKLMMIGTLIPLVAGAGNTYETALIKFVQNASTQAALDSMITEECKNQKFSQLIHEMQDYIRLACTLSELMQEDISDMITAVSTIEQNFHNLWQNWEEYYHSTRVKDTFYMNNFMQVDLYYETLQYEVTEEQEAFVIGSLFSEVGGFLGLLLGASVLTMLEIVDYIILILGQTFNSGKSASINNKGSV